MKYYYLYLVSEFAESKPIITIIGSFESKRAFEKAKKALMLTLECCDRNCWEDTRCVFGQVHCYVTFRYLDF